MIQTERINPGYGSDFARCYLLSKLTQASRIEIHNTDDPNLPYEVRVISSKEMSQQAAKIRDLFVEIIIENHTKNQSFRVLFGDNSGGLEINLRARRDGRIIHDIGRVNRDLTPQIWIRKLEEYTHDEEVSLELDESDGCWTTAKIALREAWLCFYSWLTNFVAGIIRFFTSCRQHQSQ